MVRAGACGGKDCSAAWHGVPGAFLACSSRSCSNGMAASPEHVTAYLLDRERAHISTAHHMLFSGSVVHEAAWIGTRAGTPLRHGLYKRFAAFTRICAPMPLCCFTERRCGARNICISWAGLTLPSATTHCHHHGLFLTLHFLLCLCLLPCYLPLPHARLRVVGSSRKGEEYSLFMALAAPDNIIDILATCRRRLIVDHRDAASGGALWREKRGMGMCKKNHATPAASLPPGSTPERV